MSKSQPNIILIITDQQRYETINALGYPYMETPNLDRMIAEGLTLTNCHVAGASCMPSRASLFTGYYPHTTGILKNGDLWRHSWIELLADAGYHTVNIGKMHTGPMDTPLGFKERFVVENKDRFFEARYFFDEWDKALAAQGLVKQRRDEYRLLPDYSERLGAFEWNLPPEMQSDMFVGNMANWWLETKPLEEPLFMQIGFPGPHPPYDPVPSYLERYMDKELPLPDVREQDLEGQPPPLLAMRRHNTEVDHDSLVHQFSATRDQQHRQRAYYFANMTMIDEKVGLIMNTLKSKGYLDNAIVIFTSDHGDCMGDHGHSQKWTMYDAITRVPCIFWGAGIVPAGVKCDELVQQMDLGQTLLELAGVKPPESLETRSLMPLLKGSGFSGRSHVYCEQARDGILQETEFMSMVRSRDWKLVHFLGESFGQLFNLKNDPGEFENLWNDRDAAPRKAALLDQLREWRIESGCTSRGWAREYR